LSSWSVIFSLEFLHPTRIKLIANTIRI
jgi:hypothetical protein